MALIQCTNPACKLNESSIPKPFEWNEFDQLEQGGEVVEQGTPNSKSLAIKCPTCGIRNIIW